jgi:TatD DNase family protein
VGIIDSHCHLADEVFAGDLAAVVARAREAGVDAALCILSADEPDEVARAAAVQAAWPRVQCSTGIHPHRAGAYAGRADEAARIVRAAAAEADAAAIGEIGLDYHYDLASRGVQREVFAAQVDLALALGRPVVIHAREAMDDTLAVLREAGPAVRGVMHCFTGTRREAEAALDIGFFVSISGIVTFPRAAALHEIAAFVPSDRLLVETDAPFLAPVPHRGARNEPAFIAETVSAVARLRGVPPEALAAQVATNFRAFLGEGPAA